MKRKLLQLFAMFLITAGATAQTTIYPTKERVDRTDKATPTAWNSGFPKISTATGNTQCEVKNKDARIWTLQQYVIPNIDAVESISITFTRVSGQTNNGPLAIWGFNYDFPADNAAFSTAEGSYIENVKSVLGVYPGNDITNSSLAETTGGDTRTASLDVATLKTKGTITDGTLTVNLLLTTSSGATNYKFYSINEANEDANKTRLTVSYYTVSAEIGSETTYYTNLASAMTAVTTANADATLTILDDTEISSQIVPAAGHTLNIVAGKDNVKIIKKKEWNSTLLFGNWNSGSILNLGSADHKLVIDGNNKETISTQFVECTNGTTVIENVTFEDCNTTKNQGIVCSKAAGALTLKNTTFNNCEVIEGYGIVFNGRNDLLLVGDNVFSNCTGYDFYCESRLKDGGMSNSTPLKIYFKPGNIKLNGAFATNVATAHAGMFELVNDNVGFISKGNNKDLAFCEAYTLTIGEAKAATLVIPYSTTIPSGVTLYSLNYTAGKDYVKATEVTGETLAANTPVLVNAEVGKYKFVTTTVPSNANTTELPTEVKVSGALTGVYETTTVPAGSYILAKKGENVGFYQADGSTNTVAAYRAYLTADGAGARLSILFGDETTGIKSLTPSPSRKGEGSVYTLSGQRVEKATRGIYVKNGKKVFVK